ncbi:Histidine kinase-, DNA gyrase B-, and HSP90-like ATPase [Paraburkholderia megapolitana]|uniref:histidine kinase n=2 Tax=Paraburkholderia megapolitana TaxID=420953 RepID=A0A1I3WBE8_9BURK|nr:Histidine kinase-, DNA gyrase B-, and HSP90-like ATPase [Paraburkholderia megapolitana]
MSRGATRDNYSLYKAIYWLSSLVFIAIISYVAFDFMSAGESLMKDLAPSLDSYSAIERIQIPTERLMIDVVRLPDPHALADLKVTASVVRSRFDVFRTGTRLGDVLAADPVTYQRMLATGDRFNVIAMHLTELQGDISGRERVIDELENFRKTLVHLNNDLYPDQIRHYALIMETTQNQRRLFIYTCIAWSAATMIWGGFFMMLGLKYRRTYKEKEDAIQRKSLFVALFNHELRSPLQSLVGHADNLLEKVNDRPDLASGQSIETEVKAIDRCVETIQARMTTFNQYSRLEAGKVTLIRESVDVHEMVLFVVESLRAVADEKGISILADAEIQNQDFTVDKQGLQQILENIIGNAVKFTTHGNVAVSASVVMPRSHERCLQIRVTDTGIGMTAAEQEKIFDPFFRAERTGGIGGVGLGLAMVKFLVDIMGGDIRVSSKIHEGTEVTVRIPVA